MSMIQNSGQNGLRKLPLMSQILRYLIVNYFLSILQVSCHITTQMSKLNLLVVQRNVFLTLIIFMVGQT